MPQNRGRKNTSANSPLSAAPDTVTAHESEPWKAFQACSGLLPSLAARPTQESRMLTDITGSLVRRWFRRSRVALSTAEERS